MRLTPFFFGDSASHLLGVLHEPAPAVARGHGVLLCPPIAQEHVRTHWAMRQVALSLTKAGFHCLRFDWFGVGDSAGELSLATVARWTDDAVLAAQELRDVSGVRRLSLVGLRIGASIAAMAASRIGPATVVLWDPVLDGDRYVSELRRLHEEVVNDPRRYWEPTARRGNGAELVGFDFGATLLEQIRAIDAAALADLPKARVRLLCSSAAHEPRAFEQALQSAGFDVALAHTALDASWSSRDAVEDLLLAADATRIVQGFLTEPVGHEARAL